MVLRSRRDGAFLAFPTVDKTLAAFVDLQKAISVENAGRAREHQLNVRIGIHWGTVLTDGVQVTGDAVNLCSRLTATAETGEMRLTREAFQELTNVLHRLSCRPAGQVQLKGIGRPVETVIFDWRDRTKFPSQVKIEETGREIPLPQQDIITFGRLKD